MGILREMDYEIKKPEGKNIKATIDLPSSKSISNRVLIMNALSSKPAKLGYIAKCDDTDVMVRALEGDGVHVDIGAAGTAMRFLTAYYSQKPGTHTITGSERMRKRPIKILVDALNEAGANITYAGEEGFPPLKIEGRKLRGGHIELDSSVSSQYISALMMVAPTMEQGLELELKGKLVSLPYILMTKQLMEQFGAKVSMNGNIVKIEPQQYTAKDMDVESDWSASSYWYEIAALAEEQEIRLPRLYNPSVQGDSQIANLFRPLGIGTTFEGDTVKLSKTGAPVAHYDENLVEQPDLAQTFVVTCCMLGTTFRFSGLGNLKIKETDRIAALINEMAKLGYVVTEPEEGVLAWDGKRCEPATDIQIATYEDHRMAMAFAPACLKNGSIKIANAQVVSKSYPLYWEDLKKAGFVIE